LIASSDNGSIRQESTPSVSSVAASHDRTRVGKTPVSASGSNHKPRAQFVHGAKPYPLGRPAYTHIVYEPRQLLGTSHTHSLHSLSCLGYHAHIAGCHFAYLYTPGGIPYTHDLQDVRLAYPSFQARARAHTPTYGRVQKTPGSPADDAVIVRSCLPRSSDTRCLLLAFKHSLKPHFHVHAPPCFACHTH